MLKRSLILGRIFAWIRAIKCNIESNERKSAANGYDSIPPTASRRLHPADCLPPTASRRLLVPSAFVLTFPSVHRNVLLCKIQVVDWWPFTLYTMTVSTCRNMKYHHCDWDVCRDASAQWRRSSFANQHTGMGSSNPACSVHDENTID